MKNGTKAQERTEIIFFYNHTRCHAMVVTRLIGGERKVGSLDGYGIYQIDSLFFDQFGFVAVRED